MIAALAEPAMLLIVFCLALVAGSTQLSTVSHFLASSYVGLRVSLGMALVALFMVAIAENARIPVDNPATHLELTMVHEAMILEYSGRHLAMIEFGAFLKLLLYVSLIACVFFPWQIALYGSGTLSYAVGAGAYILKAALAGFLLALFETATARCGCFASRSSSVRPSCWACSAPCCCSSRGVSDADAGLAFDVSHTLAGGLVLISLMMLYQDRLYSLLNVFALHALVLALSVAWQAFIQDAPHLYVTAVIALVFKAIVIPVALHRIVKQLGIHRDIESAVGIGPTMLAGMGLVALSLVLMLRVTSDADPLAREDLAFALSVVLLGLLVMVTRRNAVSQVVGFMSLENGLVLAATGAKGMPLVVEISVAFSILIAFIVIGIFLFRSASASIRWMSPHSTTSGANGDEPASLRSRHGRPADPDRLGGAAGRLARLPAGGAAECRRQPCDIPVCAVPVRLRAVPPQAVCADRRPEHRLHRAQYLRGIHHQHLQRDYIAHELEASRLTPFTCASTTPCIRP